MLKNSAVNSKVVRPPGSKRLEKPQTIEKSSTKNEENNGNTNKNTVATTSKKTTTVTATKKIPSSRDVNTTIKSQINSKTVVAKPKQATPIAPTIKAKITTASTNKGIRQQPMRAIHQVQAKKPVAEKNVMNTIHNVTVASPPPVRKEITNSEAIPSIGTLPNQREQNRPQLSMDALPRERTKTRTLGPEEVMILKQAKGDQKTTIVSDTNSAISTKIEQKPVIIQEPVAFEITFEKPATSPTSNVPVESSSKPTDDTSDGDYEDDFDSYESDFETESSASSQTSATSTKSEDNESSPTNTPAESSPVFPVVKKLDDDRDFDSGTYELKGTAEKVQLDSIDERELHSESQNDSGFGYNNATPSPIDQNHSTSSSLFSKPSMKPTYNKRGMELMKKINLDTMTFTLFELKPLSYDLYMKIYGHKNTNQISTQTMGNMIDQDAQTEIKAKQSMWTQYPPNFVANVIATDTHHQDRVGCGEGAEDEHTVQQSDECLLDDSLKIINRTSVIRNVRSTKPIDYERLNFFLQKSAVTVSAICDTSVAMKDLQKSESTFSEGYFRIPIDESTILNETAVHYIYSNPMIENVVYLAHRQRSTSRTHDSSYVTVWNILDTKKPVHVLSCWSLIICLEVHLHFQDVVIGGLTDGCVAVWNLNESTFWHQSNNQESLPPTQIVSPSIDTKSIAFDFGCIISLRSVYSTNNIRDDDFKLTQICSLHEFGMLTIWTILKTNSHSESCTERKIDHRSPWNKIQLIQSNIIDLASVNLDKKVRPKSGFEKKKLYFESNLFSDAALRELHDFDAQKCFLDQSETFRCVDLEYHEDGVVIATNKSFLFFVPISLNRTAVRKMYVDDSNLLHASKLKSVDDVLFVGLTDGSVKVIRVTQSNVSRKSSDKKTTTTTSDPFEQNNFSAKSCAIQNIIKEERKFCDDNVDADSFKRIEKVIDDATMVLGNRFINNQVLLPALSSNRDFVRWLDVSVNLNCMMSLCGERLRVINFQNSVEVVVGSESDIGFAAIVSGFNRREYMISLEEDSVRVHLLRKNKLI